MICCKLCRNSRWSTEKGCSRTAGSTYAVFHKVSGINRTIIRSYRPPFPKYEPVSDNVEDIIDASGAPVKLKVLLVNLMLLEYASSADAPEMAKLLINLQSCMESLAPCSRIDAAVVDAESPENVDVDMEFGVGLSSPPTIAMAPPEYAEAWKNFVLDTDMELGREASK